MCSNLAAKNVDLLLPHLALSHTFIPQLDNGVKNQPLAMNNPIIILLTDWDLGACDELVASSLNCRANNPRGQSLKLSPAATGKRAN